MKPHTAVAIEDPGYPDMRNIFTLMSDDVRPVAVDAEGIDVAGLTDSELVFVTPSHQFPTNVTMSLPRRRALLEWADNNDALIIEDDYEFETNYIGEPTPALKSLDGMGRVLYIGSLSKSIMPGLRMGYLVGPSDLIAEVRALRRLMLRHPPGNNQRIVALFLSLGRHDALIGRLHRAYSARWKILGKALEDHFPGWFQSPGFGAHPSGCADRMGWTLMSWRPRRSKRASSSSRGAFIFPMLTDRRISFGWGFHPYRKTRLNRVSSSLQMLPSK